MTWRVCSVVCVLGFGVSGPLTPAMAQSADVFSAPTGEPVEFVMETLPESFDENFAQAPARLPLIPDLPDDGEAAEYIAEDFINSTTFVLELSELTRDLLIIGILPNNRQDRELLAAPAELF